MGRLVFARLPWQHVFVKDFGFVKA